MGSRNRRTRRKPKKTPRKQRAYMKLFKGGVLEYQRPGINSSDTLYMDEIPYRLFKKSGIGMFGVKFFKNKQGEQIIVKEIPLDGSGVAQTAYDNIHDLGLMQGIHGFIVRILDEGYVYAPTQTRELGAAAYMYAMEPCSGSLSPYVTKLPVDTNVIIGLESLVTYERVCILG